MFYLRGMAHTAPDSDAELFFHGCDGHRDDFKTLVERYATRLFRYAYTLLRDTALAEDAVQNAFQQAFRDHAQFRRAQAFESWIYGILRHRCMDMLRQRKIQFLPEQKLERLGVPYFISSDIEWNELRRALRVTIQKLPPYLQEILQLRYYEDLSIHDMAQVTGRSEAVIQQYIHRALQELRRLGATN